MAKYVNAKITLQARDGSMKTLAKDIIGQYIADNISTNPKETPPMKPVTSLSAYDILGVAPSSSDADIKSAYRRQVKLCHPDIAGDTKREEFEDLQRAYKLLSDPKSRKKYDAIRELEEKSKNNIMAGSALVFNTTPNTPYANPKSKSYLQNAFQVHSNLPPDILSMVINRSTTPYGSDDEINIEESGANFTNPGEEYFINNLPVGIVKDIRMKTIGNDIRTLITLIL